MKKTLLLFVSLAFASAGYSQPGSTVTETATRFLSTLSAEELQKTQYAFTDSLRFKWTNLPVGLVPRPGIAYGSLSDKSRMAFHRVLSAMLSSQGYLKTTSLMQLDDILNTLYQQSFDKGEINQKLLTQMQNMKWAHGNYYIINGPDFLIEYGNVGFQNDGNHIHAILREKGNDFGADILKQHYLEAKH